MKISLITAAMAVGLSIAGWSQGAKAIVLLPVTSNAYITQSGLDWAWANAVQGADLSFQGAFGWRLPTPGELTFAPFATAFLFPGANAGFQVANADPISGSFFNFDPLNSFPSNGVGACAAGYFNTVNTPLCNWGNGLGQQPGNSGWAGSPGAQSHYEQLVVRTASQQVPEPATLTLFGLGFAGLGFARRRKKLAA